MLISHFEERGIALTKLPDGSSVPLVFSDAQREHLATRRGVGLFDFSFMGWWAFTGRDALACLQRLQTRDLRQLQPGRLCYTLLCREDGSVFIDATVWCHRPDQYWLFTGRRGDFGHLRRCAQDFDVAIAPLAQSHAVIAVQGPASAALLAQALPGSVDSLSYFGFRRHVIDGGEAWVGRLGYTGEPGYELLVAAADVLRVWRRLATVPFGLERLECGMQAADALRIEAGYIHFAHELAQPAFPAELGMSHLVRIGGGEFIGRGALRDSQTSSRRISGVTLDGRVAMRAPAGYEGRRTVRLTSEAFSPVFGRTLGLAFVERDSGPADVVYTGDGRRGRLARLPFRDPMRRLVRRSAPGLQA
ncbi:MAG: aminomethyltransferase family protein [Betaproteobacteria bacterium]|nr:aminomethyltransferase family protein [Betaproteobacteria bacterium]